MNNIEIVFKNVKLQEIDTLVFVEFGFVKGKEISSHFYDEKNKQDIELDKLKSLEEHFSLPGTGNIYIKKINIGICINNVMTVISSDSVTCDIVLNFEENELLQCNEDIKQNCGVFLKKIQRLIDKYDIGAIMIGYEPAVDEDMRFITFTQNEIQLAENTFSKITTQMKMLI